MVIFNSYVKLPEGTSILLAIEHLQGRFLLDMSQFFGGREVS
jgi:hypothetical protein